MNGRRGHGEGSIYHRASDGRWVGVLDLGWSGGKRRRRTVYGRTRGEVAAGLKALQRSQEYGVDLLAKRRSVSEWLDEWMRDVKALDGTRGTTIDRYRVAINKHLKPGLGRIRLDKLNPRDVQLFVGSLAGQMSPASVVKIHAVLRSSLSDAERLSLVPRNVAKSVRVPSIPRSHRRSLTMAEGKQLLAAARGDRIEGVLVLALAMGMRRSEILGLRWEDVSIEERTLTVRQTLVRSGGQLHLSAAEDESVVPAASVAGDCGQGVGGAAGPAGEGPDPDGQGLAGLRPGLHHVPRYAVRAQEHQSAVSRSSARSWVCRGCGCMICGTAAPRSCWGVGSSRGR